MRSALFLALALAFSAALRSPALAEEPAPQIEAWPVAQIEAMGQGIYRQDVAVWVATDALIAKLGGRTPTGLTGWIVIADDDDQIVRFVTRIDGVLKTGWDVPIHNGVAGAVVETSRLPLSDEEAAMVTARQTALDAANPMRCSATVNTAVARDPQGDGWLVWILTPIPGANTVPMGGHQRLRISHDGKSILRRDLLSAGCMNMEMNEAAEGRPEAMWVNTVVSDRPTEAHVLLSLQHRMPIYVMTKERKLYIVDGGHIRDAPTPR